MADVIRFLREKTENGFDAPTYLGAEQRFVNSLRGSGVNNLEEQYILGTNTYTESYVDENGNGVIEKVYSDITTNQNNYYKVISTFYIKDNKYYYDSFLFDNDNNALYLPYDVEMNIFDLFIDRGDFESGDYPTEFTPIREDKLYYYNGQQNIEVLVKTVSVKYEDDGDIIKKIVKEDIDNKLINN